MRERLASYFAENRIEYFSVLDYGACRETAKRIIDRESFVPRSVIVYLLPYYAGNTVNISRYAASLDYHIIISEINRGLVTLLSEGCVGSHAVGYGDHSPIDERHAALIGGLGILGDNGLLINEKYGSYVFIGDVVTDIEPSALSCEKVREILFCESCGACKRACPTRILSGEGDTCLSFITQKKGDLSEGEATLMRRYGTVWGCDECQSVCPHNRNPRRTPLEFFYKDRIENLTRQTLDSLSDGDFRLRPFAWRGRRVVERNLDLFEKKEKNQC